VWSIRAPARWPAAWWAGPHGRAGGHCRCRAECAWPRHDLAGEVVLVTAGGTREALDPVRFLGNRSSGKMGYALADAAQSRGARVILISGPSALHPPAHCELVKVTTADQMRQAVLERMSEATLVVKAAAVADYRPVVVSDHKLKRTGPITLELAPTEDILAEVVRRRRPGQIIVGFAAETNDPMENGRAKLLRKGADAIVVNTVNGEGVGIEADSNAATFLTPTTSIELHEMPKRSSPTAFSTRFSPCAGRARW
jgi:phosphopantothenoylcysteine decarboxylase/phosphopantothenate--cysteine ligase